MSLSDQVCEPCKGGIPPLTPEECQPLLAELTNWEIVEGHHLKKVYKFSDFKEALAFTNAVGDIAESVGHHPDIALSWGQVVITVWTHKIDGLAKADFIFAAKCDVI